MKIRSFVVLPQLPEALEPLRELAFNLYFCWHSDVQHLFRKLDPDLWEQSQANPVRMLSLVDQSVLNQLAEDKHYLAELKSVHARFTEYMNAKTWYETQHGKSDHPVYAYFCAEFGIHESLPIYSGGLGVLAGDHMKAASDMGLPLVGVGLLYRQGYFHQYLNAEGMQQEAYPENDYYTMPVSQVLNSEGHPISIKVPLGEDSIKVHLWRVNVGRICIYLLDTNLEENQPVHRDITRVLYDPDRDTRIKQEIILGIGGFRALESMEIAPEVFHVNEGHSAFLAIERLRQLTTQHQLDLNEAKEAIWASTVFTTHTPVPAGNERFDMHLIKTYLKDYVESCNIPFETLCSWGQEKAGINGSFSMTVLALAFAAHCNGVSKLHGSVSRNMWQSLYPAIPVGEVPISHITNGVHAPTWLSNHLRSLFLRYATSDELEGSNGQAWDFVDRIPEDELWEIHEFMRRRMVNAVRRRIQRHLERRSAGAEELAHINRLLDPKVLTLGFARRFATYKRGYLLFSQPDRLSELINNKDQPIQIVIAGKAHPADMAGKEVIKGIYTLANRPEFRDRIVFVEDYDMEVGRFMTQGVDVWVNTPRRPLEASGTSGMKAALNGVLNLSVLDGWWDEAFHAGVGWPIGNGETYMDQQTQDAIESDLLYGTLERKIVPMFYSRDDRDVPCEWVKMMKNSIRELGGMFNASRMLREYTQHHYVRALDFSRRLSADEYQGVRTLSTWRERVNAAWPQVSIAHVESSNGDVIKKGEELTIQCWVNPGELTSDDLRVECIHGSISGKNEFITYHKTPMTPNERQDDLQHYVATIRCMEGGHYGYTIRVMPGHTDLAHEIMSGMMKWTD
ncbi:MAG: alpha-glucan family phosphorylase [Acidobacteria bacterium]|nr:alpha-glucan family phosphorylase [Acidobacteriota bacterium]